VKCRYQKSIRPSQLNPFMCAMMSMMAIGATERRESRRIHLFLGTVWVLNAISMSATRERIASSTPVSRLRVVSHSTLLAMVRLPQAALYTSHVTRHTSHVTRHTSHATRHTPHVTRHTSHVKRHTSHVTRHTSHDTRHTSHVAHHTSHVSRQTSHGTRDT